MIGGFYRAVDPALRCFHGASNKYPIDVPAGLEHMAWRGGGHLSCWYSRAKFRTDQYLLYLRFRCVHVEVTCQDSELTRIIRDGIA